MANRILPELRITHNHGSLVLKDAELIPYTYNGRTCHTARGTVVSGGVTNRLFHATSTTPFPKGEIMSWDIFGKEPLEAWDAKGTGRYYVDCCFCG